MNVFLFFFSLKYYANLPASLFSELSLPKEGKQTASKSRKKNSKFSNGSGGENEAQRKRD